METKLRWADRDAGQRLTIVMVALFLAAGTITMAVVGFIKFTTGPTATDRAMGLGFMLNVIILLFGAFRRWSNRHAR